MENENVIRIDKTAGQSVKDMGRVAAELAHVEHVKGAWKVADTLLMLGGVALLMWIGWKIRGNGVVS